MSDINDFEYTLTRRALRQIKAEVWDIAYQHGAVDTLLSPRDATENPYREEN